MMHFATQSVEAKSAGPLALAGTEEAQASGAPFTRSCGDRHGCEVVSLFSAWERQENLICLCAHGCSNREQ